MNPEVVCRDMTYIHPTLKARYLAALPSVHAKEPHLTVFETWRSPTRQAMLYAKGRNGDKSPRITNALPWASWHQFGLALDVACFIPADPAKHVKASWSWDFDKDLVKGALIGVHRLEPGPAFEAAHFQLTGGLKISEAFNIHRVDGILGVWARVTELLAKSA